MTAPDETWNPEDGPAPTDEERDDARALGEALHPSARPRLDTPEALLHAVALRVRATARPDAARTRAVAADAIDQAIAGAGARWYRSRWRWLALVAAALLGVGGAQLALFRPPPTEDTAAISHAANDVWRTPLGEESGSNPIGALTDTRMRSYRDGLFRAHARRSP